ncbi:MAG: SDR family oxidoreductase [bacterium]
MNVALITGASSGIGYELAKCHAKNKKDLVIVSRNIDSLNKVKEELESNYQIKVVCIQKDLSNPSAPLELYNEIKELNIEVDYLINNAGAGLQGYFNEQDYSKYNSLIQLNINSLTELTHLFLNDFIKRKKGKILNVASIAAYHPGPMLSVYSATKSYVLSFSNAIAQEVKQYNISITTLIPGITQTNFGKSSNMNNTKVFKKTKSPIKVAEKGYKAMLKGKLNVKAGVSFKLGFLTKLAYISPKWLCLKITMYLQK